MGGLRISGTAATSASVAALPNHFIEQARRRPTAPALFWHGEQISNGDRPAAQLVQSQGEQMTDHTRMIKEFIVKEFMPDVPVEQLETDYDLLAGGVIDSLGLLRAIVWLEDTFQIPLYHAEIVPESFRSVAAIRAFIEQMNRQVVTQATGVRSEEED
jgi:acyl carrier protein